MEKLTHLEKLESKSIYLIREAYVQFKNIAVLWSIGKDSTALIWLCRKSFFGKMPFPIVHIDTGHKFPEMYRFRDKYSKEWGLNLIIAKNERAIAKGIICGPNNTYDCSTQLKTEALKQTISKHNFKAILVGIRRDEHGIRAKERYVSPRDKEFKWDYAGQPAELWDQYKDSVEIKEHARVHPLLHWTELDVWQYIKKENIPVNSLYFAKNGKRYRSLGCKTSTFPIESDADTVDKVIEELKKTKTSERAGRALDKESAYMMGRLRALGYM